MTSGPLDQLTIADLSSGIAGGYCTKLLVDGGARVIKIEDARGDALRAWSSTGASTADADGALFRYLSAGKESVLAEPNSPDGLGRAERVLRASDAIVWSAGSALAEDSRYSPTALRKRFPDAIVVALSAFGLDGPWAGRAATEFTLQAWAGAIGWRGSPDRPPISVGGRPGEWVTGVYAANGLLAVCKRSDRVGRGELLDVAMLDAIALTLTNMHPVSYLSEAGTPRDAGPTSLLPGIHPTRDGWVGFMTGTGQQWQDFCVLIERFDWLEDETLVRAVVREGRRNEIAAYINDWTSQRSTDEVVEMASLLRIPVAPVGTGQSIPDVDHFVDRQMLVTARDGSFVQPSRPYRFGAHEPAPPATAPALGADSGRWETALPISVKDQPARLADGLLPFADLRIAELAGFWAGPSAAHLFAVLGAEVIKIESPVRPDGMRTVSTRGLDEPDWWEHAPLYHAVNTGKLSLGLRLDRARGRSVLERLLSRCDVLIENFSPRVLEAWGLGWEAIHAINPRLILVRMPAFGLAGPWRDRTGFAQTMEQASGMAWVTGFPEGAPVVPSGVCDPVAGAHAAFALQVALAERDRTGLGTLVEVPMVQSALNIAAEQVVEFSAYGRLVSRRGNRGTTACPQNLYRTLGSDGSGLYVALAVETDDQWRFLVKAIGNPNWAVNPEFADASGRRAAEEYIDEKLSEWIGAQRVEEVIDHLWGVGIPVARVTMPHAPAREQLDARSFFETVHQPVAGPVEIAGLPIRFGETVGRVHRSHAPLLGEHNHDVLARVLGLDADEIAELLADGTVGAGLGVER